MPDIRGAYRAISSSDFAPSRAPMQNTASFEGNAMAGLVRPHGGRPLGPLALTGEALAAERARAASLPAIRVSSREKGDLVMLGIGGFTPLDGFMTRADWQGVCDGYRTAAGVFLPISITLSHDTDGAGGR